MDYIYSHFYYGHKRLGTPTYAFAAFMELSMLMMLNFTVGYVICFFNYDVKLIEYKNYIGVFIAICLFNYFRFLYNKRHEHKFVKYLDKKSKVKDRMVMFYVIISIITFIASVFIMRYRIIGHL